MTQQQLNYRAAMIGLLLIMGAAALHRLPEDADPQPAPCPHPFLVERAGRLRRLCLDSPRVPLGRVLELAGVAQCAGKAGGMVTAGAQVKLTGGCETRVLPAPAPTRLTLGLRLDLNRASELDLAALPRIGPALARRIVEDRARRGPFASVAALTRVKGIGPAILARVRGMIIAERGDAGAR